MRNLVLAAAAAAVAVPTTLVVPIESVQAQSRYYRNGTYTGPVWRDRQGRYRCRRGNGTTGLIVGAAGGALVGRAIDTHGSRATGTIVGAVAGALIGREVQRSRQTRHCR